MNQQQFSGGDGGKEIILCASGAANSRKLDFFN